MKHRLVVLFCSIASFVSGVAQAAPHPLEPLTAAEIATVATVVEAANLCPHGCYFPSVALNEPPKARVRAGTLAGVPREALVTLLDRDHNRVTEVVIDVVARRVVSSREVPGAQPLIMIEELDEVPEIVRREPLWQAAMARRGITHFDEVHVDAWAQGYAEPETAEGLRLARALSFYKGDAINRYGRPIEGVVAIVDMTHRRVVQLIDRGVVPIAPDSQDFFDPAWLGPPRAPAAPLHVVQPHGPDFEVFGHEVRWQKWRFRYALQPREGLVLYDVRYEDAGVLRPVLYRASLSEMVVPYGDPDPIWSWRSAFDVGEYGIGRLASPLQRGVDTPDNAVLLDAAFADDRGRAYTARNVVALYERDGGLLWKHYDIFTGQNAARRGRELVISFVTTVGNYDYALAWVFKQDGSIKSETDLTGIMLPKGVAQDAAEASHHAHVVAPGVAAPHHQHYFSFRLDMDVDGTGNTVMELNTRALPVGDANPRHNALVMEATPLTSELQARRQMSLDASRKWAVVNPSRLNALGEPVGYALVPGDNSVPYAWPTCFARQRAGFIDHHLWVTRYHANELYAAGDFPNQSLLSDGLPRWTLRDEALENQDVVLWYTLGVTHVPRPEEWPVMPTHRVGFSLLPVGFFARNPALDVR